MAPLLSVPATPQHIATFFQQGPRPIEREEWLLATGEPLSEASFKTAIGSAEANATLDAKGQPIALWGAIPDPVSPHYGNFWLLTTEVAESPLTASDAATLAQPFAALVALAHPDNHSHQAHLEALGFDRVGSFPAGPASTDFAAFVLHNKETH